MKRFERILLLVAGGSIALLVSMQDTRAQLWPLPPNVAVATCQARPAPAGARFVVGVMDIRDPICNAPPFAVDFNTGSVNNWFAPMYHNEMPNPTLNPADEWTAANLGGEVFGIALDNDPNPNIYVTATSSYLNAFPSSGRISKLDGTTGAISVCAVLPNTGAGLGNIAFEQQNRQFYVSNFEDGKIYRLDSGCGVLDTFDPFGPDDGLPGFAPLEERVWGLQVNPIDGRLYFGTWSQDAGRGTTPNRIYAVDLAPDGSFSGAATLQVSIPLLPSRSFNMPVSDISFSLGNEMLIAERGMVADTSAAAHQARILQFVGGYSSWSPGATFEVGRLDFGFGRTNSSGGVDHTDCVEADACNPGPLVMTTADVLDCCSAPNNIYGIQVMPATGGDLLNSWTVDLDADTIDQDKTSIGDVEVVRTCLSSPPTCDSPHTQGYWHRQCLGLPVNEGGIDPGRAGRGPQSPIEPEFAKELMPAVDSRLESTLAIMGQDVSCQVGMDADPPSDPCERASKQFTALLFNLESGRLEDFCEVDLAAQECAAAVCAKNCILSGAFCDEPVDCPGTCTDGSPCFDDSECPRICGAASAEVCLDDSDCPGVCGSTLGDACVSDADCDGVCQIVLFPFSDGTACSVAACPDPGALCPECPPFGGLPQACVPDICGEDTCGADTCIVDACAGPCFGPGGFELNLSGLTDELAQLINSSNEESCRLAADCAAAVNEGSVVAESVAVASHTTAGPSEVQPSRASATVAVASVAAEKPADDAALVPGSRPVVGLGTLPEVEAPEGEREQETPTDIAADEDPHSAIQRHLEVLAGSPDGTREETRSRSIDALLTALSGGYELDTRIQIMRGLLGKVDVAYESLLAEHLWSIHDEAAALEKNDVAAEAKQLLDRLATNEE